MKDAVQKRKTSLKTIGSGMFSFRYKMDETRHGSQKWEEWENESAISPIKMRTVYFRKDRIPLAW